MTTRDTLSKWFGNGLKQGKHFMIVVCDTYDNEDYPVYTEADNFASEYERVNGKNMQKVMEVYNLNMDKTSQLDEYRAFHYPIGFNPYEA